VRLLALIAAALVALAAASSAAAKGCVRIQAAGDATVGESISVTVRTYRSVLAGGRVVPGRSMSLGIPRLKLTAEGPDGQVRSFVTRELGNGEARVVRITLGVPGVWRVTATNWRYAPRSCAPPAFVRVRPS
jgi:hypothetical protein